VKLTLAALVASSALALFVAPGPAEAQTGASSIFKAVPTPNPNFNSGLFAASASSPTDIWAVGDSVAHFDGTKWRAFTPAMNSQISSLNGVVAISPTLAWAAGNLSGISGTPGQIIERWNGTKWSVFPGPTFSAGDQPSIFAMTSTSAKDIWAIGSLLSDSGQLLSFLFEHWDGKKWTATSSISGDAFLFGASADATNDVWVVGFNGPENDDSKTLALHYDGASWTQAITPSVGTGANQLNGVLALASNDVWAVGFSTPVPPPTQAATLTLIEHFDGTTWSVVPSPNVGPNSIYQSNRLFGLTANSPTDIYAFGSYFAADGSGHQMTLLLHWDGVSWTIIPSPNPTNGVFLSDLLFAGVVPSPGNVWIVGAKDIPPNDDSLAIHTVTGAIFEVSGK
jgi:hypothetical protein